MGPDFIKLDSSLTKGIESDRSRRARASALISFAAELDAIILAEGLVFSRARSPSSWTETLKAVRNAKAPNGSVPTARATKSKSV